MPQTFHRADQLVVALDDSSNPDQELRFDVVLRYGKVSKFFFSGLVESVMLTPLRYPLNLTHLPPREQDVARHCCVLETPSKSRDWFCTGGQVELWLPKSNATSPVAKAFYIRRLIP